MQAPPPGGVIRPNAKALSLGLSFAQVFANGPASTWLARGGLAAATKAIPVGGTNLLKGAFALSGSGAYWGASSVSNTYALNPTQGTLLAVVVADHNPNDGAAHMIAHFGSPAFPAGPAVEMIKFNDSNFYFGMVSTSNKRITASAIGKYSAGEMFSAATTWSPAGQAAYCKGALLGTNALTGLGNTSGSDMSIATLLGTGWPWATSTGGGVMFVLAFDQALTASQVAEAEADFWWWARHPVSRREPAGPIPPTPVITATGSIVTSPPDFGYPQSLTRGPPNPAMSV